MECQADALQMLLEAYRDEITWLLARAEEHQGQSAETYVHRARNLQAIMDGYERLKANRANANRPHD